MKGFTLRRNGQRMKTFRIEITLSESQVLDLVARDEKLFGDPRTIRQILESMLYNGMDRLTLDPNLDPEEGD